ncbi:SGNH/GDSL hydrolase family protein [Legionella spiritensis]|uniref:Lysophospholipase A n=1 Tax=Legionella spiritensis TaxID=452 RepID=A0A0W0YWP3_LEGSP|nr:SGNH/GDSL hydrolase family protein [Legionella spiritensis]KTD61259.1 lysophospholipase A [Legionella spiritensis]SNV23549.1 lysophospholipase A [Legionella spiritensis]
MKKIAGLLAGLMLSLACLAANKQFDTMVIFGDSLSDNGNIYRYLWYYLPASPPYFEGHFSNGPLWVEYLYGHYFPGDYQEGFQDYAVGGAGAVLSYKENLPFTLTFELDNYLYWHTYGRKETTLYAIWIGGNNYINGPTNIEPLTDGVTAAIGNVIERLIGYGGNKFLIANLPDLGSLPQARDNQTQQLLTDLTLAHNSKLAYQVEVLRAKYPEVTFIYFDTYRYFNEAIASPGDYGLNNVSDPCYLGGYTGWLKAMLPDDDQLYQAMKEQHPDLTEQQWSMIKSNPQLHEAVVTGYVYALFPEHAREEPLRCDDYLFWDRVHPTTFIHQLLAEKAGELIDEAGLLAVMPDDSSGPGKG